VLTALLPESDTSPAACGSVGRSGADPFAAPSTAVACWPSLTSQCLPNTSWALSLRARGVYRAGSYRLVLTPCNKARQQRRRRTVLS
jgi:hypothetical protein